MTDELAYDPEEPTIPEPLAPDEPGEADEPVEDEMNGGEA